MAQLQKEKSSLEQKLTKSETESKQQIDSITQSCLDEINSLETKLAQLEIENQTNSANKDQQSDALFIKASETH